MTPPPQTPWPIPSDDDSRIGGVDVTLHDAGYRRLLAHKERESKWAPLGLTRKTVGNWTQAWKKNGQAQVKSEAIARVCWYTGDKPEQYVSQDDVPFVISHLLEWQRQHGVSSAPLETPVCAPQQTIADPVQEVDVATTSQGTADASWEVAPFDILAATDALTAWVFSTPPWKILLSTVVFSLLCLWTPAWILDVLSIPSVPVNLGIGYSSWPWTTLLLIPVTLTLMAWSLRLLARRMREILQSGVIRAANQVPEYLTLLDYPHRNHRLWLALAIAALVTGADLAPVVPTYFTRAPQPPPEMVADWKTAFTLASGPSRLGNAWIVLAAFFIQGAATALALTWTMHFALLLHRLLGLWPGPPALRGYGFQLDPCAAFADPGRRMGLRPLGDVINLFLIVVLLFGFYMVHHRLEVLRLSRNWDWSELVATCLQAPPAPAHFLNLALAEGWDLGTFFVVAFFFVGNAAVLVTTLHVHRCRNAWRQKLAAQTIRQHSNTTKGPPLVSTDPNPIAYRAVELTDPFPNGRQTMAIYLAWIGAQGLAVLLPAFTGSILCLVLLFTILVAALAITSTNSRGEE